MYIYIYIPGIYNINESNDSTSHKLTNEHLKEKDCVE